MPTDPNMAREKRYLYPEERLYLVGMNWCYEWFTADVQKVIKLWDGGYSLETIAQKVDTTCRDTLLLLLDLAEQGKIKRRINYIWGTEKNL